MYLIPNLSLLEFLKTILVLKSQNIIAVPCLVIFCNPT